MTLKSKTLDAAIGGRVAAVRKARERRAADMAEQLNLSEADYIAREAGHERFRSRDLSILSGVLSVEISCFFEDAPHTLERTERLKGVALVEWIEASRNREGLRALLQSDHVSVADPRTEKAA